MSREVLSESEVSQGVGVSANVYRTSDLVILPQQSTLPPSVKGVRTWSLVTRERT